MALKGKKKKSSRGSQARRRPAAAPRPSFQPRTRTVWYKTPGGRIVAILFGLTILGLVIWSISSARSESARLEDRQQELEDYTTRVRALVQNLTPAASEMATASQIPPGQMEERVREWNRSFGNAQTTLSQTQAPEDLRPLNQQLLQSILLYVSAAETYKLVPDVEGDARESIVTQGRVQWTSANNLFASVIALLDKELDDAELRPSGLRPPGADAPSGPAQGAGGSEGLEVEGGGGGGNGGGNEEGGNG
ncbi:MAG: hypothetical protein ACRDKT_03210 [Actinomycetota bacterium]